MANLQLTFLAGDPRKCSGLSADERKRKKVPQGRVRCAKTLRLLSFIRAMSVAKRGGGSWRGGERK